MTIASAAFGKLVSEIDAFLQGVDHPCISMVRDGINEWHGGAPPNVSPQWLPACQLLAPALAATSLVPLAEAIGAAAPHLRWVTYDAYPRHEIGASFADGHAFCSIIGEDAPFHAEDFALGLFLIAPHTLYRDHNHAAPELYAPLTGPHGWRFRPGDPFIWKAAHQPVWNDPFQPHATLTGDVPFLCIFCWTKDVNATARVIWAPDWANYEA